MVLAREPETAPMTPAQRLPLSVLPPRDWAAAGEALARDGVVRLAGALGPDALANRVGSDSSGS
jgi:hypothetical protein